MEDRSDRALARLMLVLALTCTLGWLFKGHCMTSGWHDSIQYTTGCYSDAVPFWGGRGVAAGELPYFQARMEYPVLTGMLIWFEGSAVRIVFGPAATAGHFLFVVTLANALLAALVLWLLWRAGMDRRRLLGWAAAPPLLLYVGHNWDMLAIAFAVAALLAARRNQLVAGAGAAGLGVAAKLFPIVALPLIGLQALAERGKTWTQRLPRAALVAGTALLAWIAVNLPVALLAWDNWLEFYRFSQERSGTAASVWEILSVQGWWTTSVPERNTLASLSFAVGFALILALGWRRHRDRLWVLFTPALAWFMLTNKVYSPQFDLWLYPMLLMTAPRLAPVALFVIGDVAAYFAEFWWFAGMEGASPSATPGDIALAAAMRAAAMLWIIADAVRHEPPAWIGAGDHMGGFREPASAAPAAPAGAPGAPE